MNFGTSCYKYSTSTYNYEQNWVHFEGHIFNGQAWTIHMFMYKMKSIGFLNMTLHKLVHMYAKLHIKLRVKQICDKVIWEIIYRYSTFFEVAYKIFSNWSSNSYSSTLHQIFVACSRKAPCNHVHKTIIVS